jgi:hypothetical protein
MTSRLAEPASDDTGSNNEAAFKGSLAVVDHPSTNRDAVCMPVDLDTG